MRRLSANEEATIQSTTAGASYEALQPRLAEFCAVANRDPDATGYFREKYSRMADERRGRPILDLFRYELGVAGIDPVGQTVLDAGCGSGIFSTLFLLLGATRVEALDAFGERVAALSRLAAACNLPLTARRGDVVATGLATASVDIVFCREAISHFEDSRGFLEESRRILRPGGRLLISDSNNGANPRVRREIYRMWRELETGPFTADRFGPEEQSLPYLFRRWMILRREFPEMRDEQVFHIGLRTAGRSGEELLEVGRRSLRSGELPSSIYRYGQSIRRPEDGQRTEEPVDPRELVASLRGLGMTAAARAHFGYNRGRFLRILNEIGVSLPSLSLRLARAYLVFGQVPTGRAQVVSEWDGPTRLPRRLPGTSNPGEVG
jgi:SAM-dependent methyltransferase